MEVGQAVREGGRGLDKFPGLGVTPGLCSTGLVTGEVVTVSDVTGGQEAESEAEELLARAAGGDLQARQRLLGLHRDRLRKMVAVRLDRRIAARVDPSDVVQETLAAAAAGLSDYLRRRPLPFYPWLRQIAWDRLIEVHRGHVQAAGRSVRREETELPEHSAFDLADRLAGGVTSPSLRAAREEMRGLVRNAIAHLAATDREVLVLRHLEGLQTAEIAALLHISHDAVRARHVRAIERLRQRIVHDPRE